MYDELMKYGKTKKGADVYYRPDWDCIYFSLDGKCFGLMTPSYITLKGDPHENMRLRELYQDVTPGYYSNKVHWNTIDLKTKVITLEQLKEMMDVSYQLVFNKLTKKQQHVIQNAN